MAPTPSFPDWQRRQRRRAVLVKALFFALGLLVGLLAHASCAAEPTRVRLQNAADKALDEELHREQQCRLLSQAARVARHGGNQEMARMMAEDAARVCRPESPPEVWP